MKLTEKMFQDYIPTKSEIEYLLGGYEDEMLFKKANEKCQFKKGREVNIRAILEFSNYCKSRCEYCGLRCENKSVKRYRIAPQNIVKTALESWEAGYKTIVLQSGEDTYYSTTIMCQIIRQIKEKCDISITLSIGEKKYKQLEAMRFAGADRYLLKHETSDPKIYQKLHCGDLLKDRIQCLKDIKSLGFETGGGFMIGLPGQNNSIIAQDILLLRDIGCDMAGIGPFIAHEQTPLRNFQNGDSLLTRRAVAITRLILPDSNLPATTSLGVLDKKQRDLIFSSGANVIMKKVTPWIERKKYEIYPSNLGEEQDIKSARIELEKYIKSLDKVPV